MYNAIVVLLLYSKENLYVQVVKKFLVINRAHLTVSVRHTMLEKPPSNVKMCDYNDVGSTNFSHKYPTVTGKGM